MLAALKDDCTGNMQTTAGFIGRQLSCCYEFIKAFGTAEGRSCSCSAIRSGTTCTSYYLVCCAAGLHVA